MPNGGDFVSRDGKWIPHIKIPSTGAVVAIGEFDSQEEASTAYLAKVEELYPLPSVSGRASQK